MTTKFNLGDDVLVKMRVDAIEASADQEDILYRLAFTGSCEGNHFRYPVLEKDIFGSAPDKEMKIFADGVAYLARVRSEEGTEDKND